MLMGSRIKRLRRIQDALIVCYFLPSLTALFDTDQDESEFIMNFDELRQIKRKKGLTLAAPFHWRIGADSKQIINFVLFFSLTYYLIWDWKEYVCVSIIYRDIKKYQNKRKKKKDWDKHQRWRHQLWRISKYGLKMIRIIN